MPIESFKSLIVWQRSMELCKEVYKVTAKLPQQELYGIASQVQRASVSVPSNIAEGSKRSSRKDYANFLRIANGSLAEVETQLIIISELYPTISTAKSMTLLIEAQKMLSVMIKKLYD